MQQGIHICLFVVTLDRNTDELFFLPPDDRHFDPVFAIQAAFQHSRL